MKTVFAILAVLTAIAATPVSADRPFGSSSQGPSITYSR